MFTALRADVGALRASVAVVADKIHAHFAHAAFLTVVSLAAAAGKAHLTVAAQLIIRAVLTLLATLGAYYGTFRAALSASDADIIHTEFAKVTINTVVTVSAHTIKAGAAVSANTAVDAVLAFFVALLTDQDAFGASPAAFADIFCAVLTKQAIGAVVALAADAGKAGAAVGAELVFCTDHTLLIAFTAAAGTI